MDAHVAHIMMESVVKYLIVTGKIVLVNLSTHPLKYLHFQIILCREREFVNCLTSEIYTM